MTLKKWNPNDGMIEFVIPTSIFPKKYQLLWPMTKFIDTALGFGAGGIRFQPMRNFAAWQLFTGQLKNENLNGILCAEQSFRSERWIYEWLFLPKNKVLGLKSWFFMPFISDSFEDRLWGIRAIGRNIGNPIPVTLYYNRSKKNILRVPHKLGWPEMLVHISDELLEGINSPSDLKRILEYLGYTGYVFDVLHIGRSTKRVVLWEIAKAYVQEIHIPFWRPDFSEHKSVVDGFWKDVYGKTCESPQTVMFSELIKGGWKGRIVIEGESRKNLKSTIEDYTQAIAQLKSYIEFLLNS